VVIATLHDGENLSILPVSQALQRSEIYVGAFVGGFEGEGRCAGGDIEFRNLPEAISNDNPLAG
jgi:hypothetical protein